MGSRGKPTPVPPGRGLTQPILLPYQRRWLNDRSQKKIWLAARQIGKSFALSMEAVVEGLEERCNNLILSSSERQSREVMQKVFSHLRYLKIRSEDVICAERESRAEVELPNGSRIISLPANPDTVRGFSGNVLLDEFAFHRDSSAIWKAMYPAITRGKRIRVSSTANGRSNMFYRLWTDSDFSKHETSIHEARAQGLAVDIRALRSGITDPDSWAQEYECRFLDEATAFITYEMIQACEDEGAAKELGDSIPLRRGAVSAPAVDGESGRGNPAPTTDGEFYLGMDIGRKGDLTIFWLWEKAGDVFWTRMVKEMRNAAFAVQRDFLYGLLDGSVGARFPRPPLTANQGGETPTLQKIRIRRCCIDSTGLGAQLAEEAITKFGPTVEAVTFTQKVKEDLAVTLRRRFEDRQVRIPAGRDIREDIHSVKKFTTAAGNIRFDAERTELGHADRFWAAALGLHAGSAPSAVIEFESMGARRFFNMGGYL
ncbi:MAG: terminase family protein [Nitrospiraceae bacterium]|nr:terminase family protein [Nitrospiraceae bacterium]